MTPTPDHEALLRLLTIAERDLPDAIKAARDIHNRHGVGSQVSRVEFARTLVRGVVLELGGVEHLLDLTLERMDP